MFCKDNELIKSIDTVNHTVGQITPREAQCQMARLLLVTELAQSYISLNYKALHG